MPITKEACTFEEGDVGLISCFVVSFLPPSFFQLISNYCEKIRVLFTCQLLKQTRNKNEYSTDLIESSLRLTLPG